MSAPHLNFVTMANLMVGGSTQVESPLGACHKYFEFSRGTPSMEHYLLHLSYTTAGWDHILSTTPNFNQRMDPFAT